MLENIMISIIIPAYNVEKYIEQCLDSLLNQTYDNYEVIIIDDGSTDRTSDIVKEYENANEKIHLIVQKNMGVSCARNRGIEAALGKYIFFFDGDDYLPNNALEKMIATAELYKTDVLKFSAYTFTDGKDNVEWNEDGYKYKGNYDSTYTGKEYLKKAIINEDAYFVNNGHFITRRSLITDNKLSYIDGIIHEDIIFHWKLMMLSDKVRVLNEPLSYRRYRSGSIMQSKNQLNRVSSLIIIIDSTYEFIEEENFRKGAIEKWFLRLYARKILQYWLELSDTEQNSPEAKDLYKEIRKQMKTHFFFGRLNFLLFAINPNLYKKYHVFNQWLRKNEKNN